MVLPYIISGLRKNLFFTFLIEITGMKKWNFAI